ncbi:MAG: polyprenyl synthetase family protein [Peptococcaceae bacterium]|nr:polyprenyl synthetase family protein [Peptococcaceae bacterium]
MDFLAALAEKAHLVNGALDRYLPGENTYPQLIHRAMRYSVFSGGKRLRPALTLAAAEAVKGDSNAVLPAACAIELIHTYSLVHDDLPAMDNSDLRRGRATTHRVFGEGIAVLVGDALLTLGFDLLSQAGSEFSIPPAKVLQVVQEVAAACGTMGLIGGQVIDLTLLPKEADEKTLDYIHRTKTGALFRACVRTGAILGGADEDKLRKLTTFAEHFGLAFQIIDDILDVEGSPEKTGKTVGSDARNAKTTYVSLFGVDESRVRAHKCLDSAITALVDFGSEADFLRHAAYFCKTRKF